MFTTLSTRRSATSGIEPSVKALGDACAGLGLEYSAAPVPISPATATEASRVRSEVILVLRWVTKLGPTSWLRLFRDTGRLIGWGNDRSPGFLRGHVCRPGQGSG